MNIRWDPGGTLTATSGIIRAGRPTRFTRSPDGCIVIAQHPHPNHPETIIVCGHNAARLFIDEYLQFVDAAEAFRT